MGPILKYAAARELKIRTKNIKVLGKKIKK